MSNARIILLSIVGASAAETLLAGAIKIGDLRARDVLEEMTALVGSNGEDEEVITDQLRSARWELNGNALILHASVNTPALQIALESIAHRLREELRAAQQLHPETLANLPVEVSANVHAVLEQDGFPSYVMPGARSQAAPLLTETAVSHGLMVRAAQELYRNAIDAVRRAETRPGWLKRSDDAPHDDAHSDVHIIRRQDERGRVIIECTDHGIGMDVDDVVTAGIPGLAFYYSIASEVIMTTAKLRSDGSAGNVVVVRAAGPDSLIHIRELGTADSSGTTLVLVLHDDVENSLLSELSDLIIVCPVRLRVHDAIDDMTRKWSPGELNTQSRHIASNRAIVQGSARVWWTSNSGGIVIDGMWIDTRRMSAIIDLPSEIPEGRAEHQTHNRPIDLLHAERLMRDAVGALTPDSAWFVDGRWFRKLFRESPAAADALQEHAKRLGSWPIRGTALPCNIALVGIIGDEDEFYTEIHADRPVNWRLTALAEAGLIPIDIRDSAGSMVRPKPSDWLLLGGAVLPGLLVTYRPLPQTGHPGLQRAIAAAATGYEERDLFQRQVELGLIPPGTVYHTLRLPRAIVLLIASAMTEVDPAYRTCAWQLYRLCSEEGVPPEQVQGLLRAVPNGTIPGFDQLIAHPPSPAEASILERANKADVVSLAVVEAISEEALWAPSDVTALLEGSGFRPEIRPAPGTVIEPLDQHLISSHDVRENIDLRRQITTAEVLRIALRSKRRADEVLSRLVALGFRVAAVPSDVVDPVAASVALIDPMSEPAALPQEDPIPPAHLAWFSKRFEIPLRELTPVARKLGYTVADSIDPSELDDVDLRLASEVGDGEAPFRPLSTPIAMLEVCIIAHFESTGVAAIERRLLRMGYRIAREDWSLPLLTRSHVRLLTHDFTYHRPMYPTMQTVSSARVVMASSALSWSVADVVRAYRAMAFHVEDPRTALPIARPGSYG